MNMRRGGGGGDGGPTRGELLGEAQRVDIGDAVAQNVLVVGTGWPYNGTFIVGIALVCCFIVTCVFMWALGSY
ncbi:hypothetical protein SESBI_47364 [Sesbania bispinosa]|nr:hypothetical protein SESBI_47364 [Sesbania bispinosa]